MPHDDRDFERRVIFPETQEKRATPPGRPVSTIQDRLPIDVPVTGEPGFRLRLKPSGPNMRTLEFEVVEVDDDAPPGDVLDFSSNRSAAPPGAPAGRTSRGRRP
jgi:hypothetical protein